MTPIANFIAWFDSNARVGETDKISWYRVVPFILMHVAVLGVFIVEFSWFAIWVAVFMYIVRMFAITAFYHRYFSHKNFQTSRFVQFVFALIGASAAQRGPLWWASHHRVHHAKSDTEDDPHSPKHRGFLWSHMLWFLSDRNFPAVTSKIKDFSQYRELRILDRFDMLVPVLTAVTLYAIGEYLGSRFESLATSGWQLLIWGYFVSTVFLYHATYTINSLAHRYGSRRFETKDSSRNNWLLAILTLGEGWHNNHHYYCGTVRQGFRWYEIDLSFYILKIMSYLGLVWDLKPIPRRIKEQMALS